ncbi:MAG: alcohol dehydrogenase catalytic domain-containing protein [Alphaproteobacteria bacterium]|nr:alcohol dehydrogenase catalytic domain-containing protein [Alphaproteobacteria bacterium]
MNVGLVKDGPTLGLQERPNPTPGPHEVRLAVQLAGVCRTDVYVARDQLPHADPVVLGHELCGVVDALGPGADRDWLGRRVSVNPWVGRAQLGVDRDGGFARALCLPASCLVPVSASLAPSRAAFVEPMAAALAVLEGGLPPGARVRVGGLGRIATLARRVLAAEGFRICDAGPIDAAVEADPDSVFELVEALPDGATLLLKSRPAGLRPLPWGQVSQKRLTLRGVWYGSFSRAAQWLAEERVQVDDLLGAPTPLSRWAEVLDADAPRKHFLDPWG